MNAFGSAPTSVTKDALGNKASQSPLSVMTVHKSTKKKKVCQKMKKTSRDRWVQSTSNRETLLERKEIVHIIKSDNHNAANPAQKGLRPESIAAGTDFEIACCKHLVYAVERSGLERPFESR